MWKKIFSKIIYCLLIVYNLYFLVGCITKKDIFLVNEKDIPDKDNTEIINNEQENYFTIFSGTTCSLEEIKLAGIILLPYDKEIRIIKDFNFYIVDGIFSNEKNTKENLFELLKNLYISDGWTIQEEFCSPEYITASVKKVNKEISIFIEDKEKYIPKKMYFNKYIFMHQSLFILQ